MRLRQRLISAALRAITKPRQAAFRIPIGSPIEFEQFCADALAAAGWQAKTTAASGDQGADVIAKKGGRLLVVQCKLYSGTVGTAAVQEAHSACAFYGAHHAAVVTKAVYSEGARALAGRTGVFLLTPTDLRGIDRIVGLPQTVARPGRVDRYCFKCETTLMLAIGGSGWVSCPNCGNRYHHTT